MSAAERRRKDSPSTTPNESAGTRANGPAQLGHGWPFGVSRTPTMSIGAALAILSAEFPAVRISKIRFLEEQGIVAPHRTPGSGYRSYSQADLERLRFALAAQRDSFLPLRVIRERLEDLDTAGAGAPAPGARVVTEDGDLTTAATNSRMTRPQLAEAANLPEEFIGELIDAGVLQSDFGGKFTSAAVDLVTAAHALTTHGLQARHLRTMRNSADRQIDVVDQLITPVKSSKRSSAAAHAAEQARTIAELLSRLHETMLNDGVERL